MRNRRMMIFGILAILLIGGLITVGCGSTPMPTPEPTPEAPSVSSSSLEAVCADDGTGVPEVAPYAQTSGTHPIVYAYGQGSSSYNLVSDGTLAPPSQWRPQELADAELVACIRKIERIVEKCPYTLSSGLPATVSRVQVRVVVTLREAQTGKVVATSETMEGEVPPWCQESEQFLAGSTTKTVWGDLPSDDIHAWLKQYVEMP